MLTHSRSRVSCPKLRTEQFLISGWLDVQAFGHFDVIWPECPVNTRGKNITVPLFYEVVSNHCKNYHVHNWPGRTQVVDSRQLIPFTFSVQTGQLASPMNMTILRIVG